MKERCWFMSYIVVRSPGRSAVGSTAYRGTEHPLEKAKRWNGTAGYGMTAVLDFRELSEEEWAMHGEHDTEVNL